MTQTLASDVLHFLNFLSFYFKIDIVVVKEISSCKITIS